MDCLTASLSMSPEFPPPTDRIEQAELAHRESVTGREAAYVLAVVNYGKSAGFVPYLPGEREFFLQ